MIDAIEENGIRLLSFNCWGLKYVSKHRSIRLRTIASILSTTSYDIILLQEVWVESDFKHLAQTCSSTFPHAKFYNSAVLGGGLVVLSKWPIEETHMHPYKLNGRPTAFFRGDWYVGKGIASAIIRHPGGKKIEVFNTHLHAPYGEKTDSYMAHRTSQAWEFARLARASIAQNHILLCAGDFNSVPGSLAHRILRTYGLLADAWISAHGEERGGTGKDDMTGVEKIEIVGATCDSNLNSWRKNLPADREDPDARRLDYVFHDPRTTEVTNAKVTMLDRITVQDKGQEVSISLSDHFAIEVDLVMREEPKHVPEFYLDVGTLDGIHDVTTAYTSLSSTHSRLRILHFFLTLPLLVLLHIIPFYIQNKWGVCAIMFVAWVAAVVGVVDGLIGFLFGWWEWASLTEFDDQVRRQRRLIADITGRATPTAYPPSISLSSPDNDEKEMEVLEAAFSLEDKQARKEMRRRNTNTNTNTNFDTEAEGLLGDNVMDKVVQRVTQAIPMIRRATLGEADMRAGNAILPKAEERDDGGESLVEGDPVGEEKGKVEEVGPSIEEKGGDDYFGAAAADVDKEKEKATSNITLGPIEAN
ncbi:phospholipase C type enzyme [Saitoella coloradoensis]